MKTNPTDIEAMRAKAERNLVRAMGETQRLMALVEADLIGPDVVEFRKLSKALRAASECLHVLKTYTHELIARDDGAAPDAPKEAVQ